MIDLVIHCVIFVGIEILRTHEIILFVALIVGLITIRARSLLKLLMLVGGSNARKVLD
jgi:hypothetical protein